MPAELKSASHDHTLVLTLNDPATRNALGPDIYAAGVEALNGAERNRDIRSVIITGANGMFSAGGNLNRLQARRQESAEEQARGVNALHGWIDTIRNFPKPVIAAVEGPAAGAGFSLALACDLIVAAGHAAFGLPEVRRGLVAAAGGLYRLTRAIPRALAIELILTGEQLPAARAQAIGLVNQVVPGPELQATAIALAERISANAPLAVCESLAVARAAFDHDDRVLREMSASAIRAVAGSRDYLEGPRAFLERRPPHWSGT